MFAHDARFTSLDAQAKGGGDLLAELVPLRTLTSRGQHEWRLDVRPTTEVDGVVRGTNDLPLPSCLVDAAPEEVPSALARVLRVSTVTDARGHFTLRGLVPGLTYRVQGEGPLRAVASESILATRDRFGLELRLDALADEDAPKGDVALPDTKRPSPEPQTRPPIASRTPVEPSHAKPLDDLTPRDVELPDVETKRVPKRPRQSDPPVVGKPPDDLESLPLTAVPPRIPTASKPKSALKNTSPASRASPSNKTGALTVHVRGLEQRNEWVHVSLLRSADGIRLRAALRPGGTSVTFKRMRIGEHYTLWAPLGRGRFLYHGDVWGTEGELHIDVARGATVRGPLHGELPPKYRLATVFATRTKGTPLRVTGRVDQQRGEYIVEGLPPGVWRVEVEIWDPANRRVRGAATMPAGGTASIEMTGR